MTTQRLFEIINACAREVGIPVYVVGGFVRDSLRGEEPKKDIDFVVVGDAMRFADHLKTCLKVKQITRYPRFGTFMFRYKGYTLEFVNARAESYTEGSRKPDTRPADLTADLSRRDFTINAMARPLENAGDAEIIDIFEGRRDLEAGVIRTPLEPARTFSDDPLRMLRAIRFATRLGFAIEEKTFKAIRENSLRLQIISVERINDEFSKILEADTPSAGMRLLDESGLLAEFLPEALEMKGVDQRQDFHHKDVFNHTLQVMDNVAERSPRVELRLAALFHDIAKPRTKRFIEGTGWTFHGHEVVGERMARAILKRLKFSKETIAYVAKLVRLHLRPMALVDDEVTDSAIRRLLFMAGDNFEDLMQLCRADITSKNPQRVKRYLANYDYLLEKINDVEERDRIRNFQPPVSGEEIMEIFNCKPGPLIGRVKKFVQEAILEGDVPNDHDACVELIIQNKERFLV